MQSVVKILTNSSLPQCNKPAPAVGIAPFSPLQDMPSVDKLFTIALPVRNGGEHLKECIASILAQRFEGFDLVVLENGSSDGTAEWLKTITDTRVSVLPAAKPLSIEENWARILEIPKNEYLTTIGHDDLLDPGFLDVILRLVRKHPDAGLYLTHFRMIDKDGRFVRHCFPMPEIETASEFLAARLCGMRHSYGTGHVLRSRDYDALGGIPPYLKLLYADDALFVNAIRGSYRATALEEAFSYRYHPASESGGCSGEEMFVGLETYANLLSELQKNDGAIAKILSRHSGSYARSCGERWLHEAVISGRKTNKISLIEIENRINNLANLFEDTPVDITQLKFRKRLLADSPHSLIRRTLYRLLVILSSFFGRFMIKLKLYTIRKKHFTHLQSK